MSTGPLSRHVFPSLQDGWKGRASSDQYRGRSNNCPLRDTNTRYIRATSRIRNEECRDSKTDPFFPPRSVTASATRVMASALRVKVRIRQTNDAGPSETRPTTRGRPISGGLEGLLRWYKQLCGEPLRPLRIPTFPSHASSELGRSERSFPNSTCLPSRRAVATL